ncbi:IS200/IS605 family transposase [Halovenus rubra]|uniref:IS200/IS605 family transposase n=2 Tax=Halovenus rubra TaxID=869890 RepID=A0ABD5X520_9EURY|nr:IS200/IS605 family transposase [Halovenus rubra]
MNYDLQTGSHTVYACQYHLVTVTKYRTALLSGKVLNRLEILAHDIAADHGCEVSDVNGEADHVHLLFSAEPTTDLTEFINHLKGVTSRKLRQEYTGLKQRLPKALWQPGYFLCTTGQVTLDDLREYVENQ